MLTKIGITWLWPHRLSHFPRCLTHDDVEVVA